LILIIIQAKGAGEQHSFATTISSSTHVLNAGPTASERSLLLKYQPLCRKMLKATTVQSRTKQKGKPKGEPH
jgi:hypothetical protein